MLSLSEKSTPRRNIRSPTNELLCKRATDAQDPFTLYEFRLEAEALLVEEQLQLSRAA
jgi:hypothetical protein